MSDLGTGPSDEDPAKKLRISDADREQVLQRLQEAMSHGMITTDELTERSDAALRARTRGEIEPLLRDLPFAQPAIPAGAVPAPLGQNSVVQLGATLGSVSRKGFWVVPRKLVIRSRMGSTELDFTEAQIDHPVVDIDIDIKGGSVEMRMPAGSSVSMDDVDVMAGSIEDHRKERTGSGRPHFVIAGSLRWGSIEIRGPRRNIFNNWRAT
ncbi:MAG TPA: DUF1707 domain-containing protein [Pseudonocardiaceae bacterium]|nr:DUF1707 domain-containing protein [Pseudonocardiaceae bacterium]